MKYYKIVPDLLLTADGDAEQIQEEMLIALIDVAEKHGAQLGGSLKLVPTSEEELEAEVEEVLHERQAAAVQ